jgi:6-phospho-beta-glucosidase
VYGVEPDQVLIGQVGLNHLTWIRSVLVDGEEKLPELLDKHAQEIADEVRMPVRLIEELAAIPSYYLRYYYLHDEVVSAQRTGTPRASEVDAIERQLLQMYKDPNLTEKPALLEERGGAFYSEAAVGLVTSLAADTGEIHVVDVRNNGAVPGLADDDLVELPARVDATGAHPLSQAPLPADMLGLIQHAAAYERLAVQAAINGDPVIAHRALLANPLIGQEAKARHMLASFLEAEAQFLPQFGKAVAAP